MERCDELLFVSFALRSHAMPMILLAGELARRGHRVGFATQEEGRPWLAAHGVPFVPFEPSPGLVARLAEARARATEQESWFSAQALVMGSLADSYPETCEAVRRLLAERRPAMVVASIAVLPALDLAAREGLPLAIRCSYLSPALRRHSLGWPPWEWRAGFGSVLSLLRGVLALGAVQRRLARFRGAARAGAIGRGSSREPLHLAMVAACLEPAPTFAPRVELLGPLLPDQVPPLEPATGAWLDARRAEGVTLAAFGTFVRPGARLLAALAEGFSGSGQHVLWAVPEALRAGLPPLGPQVRLEPVVPQLAVLSHGATRAFVSHAGANSVLESLSRGVPLLAIPFFVDQPYHASRVAAVGAGLALDRFTLTARDVTEALRRLRDEPGFSARARETAGKLAATGGVRGGADVLERELRAASSGV